MMAMLEMAAILWAFKPVALINLENAIRNHYAEDKMKCPYCNQEMLSGFMQNSKPISWTPKKLKLFTHYNFTNAGAVVLSDSEGLAAPCVIAYNCPVCKKIIIDY